MNEPTRAVKCVQTLKAVFCALAMMDSNSRTMEPHVWVG